MVVFPISQSPKHKNRATEFKKIMIALPGLFEDKNYKYIDDIISTNTKSSQAYSLLVCKLEKKLSSTHHVNLESVDPIKGLDVPSGVNPFGIKTVKNPTIFNPNFHEQVQPDFI